MIWLKNLKRKIFYRLSELLFTMRYRSRGVDVFPQLVENRIVYIVSEGQELDTLILKCPCGCNEVTYLILLMTLILTGNSRSAP